MEGLAAKNQSDAAVNGLPRALNSRRERTRLKLLRAAGQVLSEHGSEKATIEDFVVAAGVARGTFYNYYETVDALLNDLWEYVGFDPFNAIRSSCAPIKCSAERFISTARMIVRAAEQDKIWGWIILYLSAGDKEVNADLLAYPRLDLEKGVEQGAFDIDDMEVAVEIAVVALRGAIRSSVVAENSDNYTASICEFLLRGFGVDKKDAKRIVHLPLPNFSGPPSGTAK